MIYVGVHCQTCSTNFHMKITGVYSVRFRAYQEEEIKHGWRKLLPLIPIYLVFLEIHLAVYNVKCNPASSTVSEADRGESQDGFYIKYGLLNAMPYTAAGYGTYCNVFIIPYALTKKIQQKSSATKKPLTWYHINTRASIVNREKKRRFFFSNRWPSSPPCCIANERNARAAFEHSSP